MTLLELLIAIFLSTLILFSLMSLYLGVQKNILMNTALMNIQNNIRVTAQIFRNAVLSAGYVVANNKMHSYQGSDMKAATEGFTVQGANTHTMSVINTMESIDKIRVTNVSHFSVGDVLVIYDAKTYDIFTVKEVQSKNNFLVTVDPLQKIYEKNAEVTPYFIDSYYVSKTDRVNQDGSKLYALYVKDIHGRKTELVEGVSDMKISYSVLENHYLKNISQNDIVDWTEVVGLSITLQFNSLNASNIKKEAYVYIALRKT